MLAIVTSVSLVACTKAQARTPAPQVALAMPVPPPRVMIPVELSAPEPPAPPPAAAPEPDRPAAPRPAARPGGNAPTTPAPVIAESPNAPVLRTTADVTALEQRTNTLLQEAQTTLDRVKYADLGMLAKQQYDSAMGFIKLARGALRVKNYMQAESLADKAAKLARELVKG
jgi:hypothetical protein